jgi:hypothetical protein
MSSSPYPSDTAHTPALKIGSATLSEPYGSAPMNLTRSWVNFNGFSPLVIRKSSNVSSVERLGTGRYRVNLIHPPPSTHYSIQITHGRSSIFLPDFQLTADIYLVTRTYFEFGVSDATNNNVFDAEKCLVTCLCE